MGLTTDAENAHRADLQLSPQYAPAAINPADLYRQLHRDDNGRNVLRTAIASSPKHAGLHHALGLTRARQRRPDDALAEFRTADRARNPTGRAAPMSTLSRWTHPAGSMV